MTCGSCSRAVPAGSRFCPHCGASAERASVEATRTSAPDDISSGPSDHGRFIPGTMLGGRYRIVALLGRGGMGEVYRADDLKLGQAVALKFLPAAVENDPGRLQRFLNEVKIARQISHPNVCRVYDVGEINGLHYLSMEYVDGEDLASLLRRIGRLPRDKAVQVSRQLCAGLAAAHEQGILHRDLKPANVMIDGRGRAKVTDFGLATLAGTVSAEEAGAGTPLYMAPEQRAGKDVTVRSDLYSLGLVLYELFTGERPTSPAHRVEGLDPAVERVLLRCLAQEPAGRPSSAIAVAAALPGGDPLAAAIAAGETPSPDLVAEAGEAGGLSPGAALACVAGVVASIALVMALSPQTQLSGSVPLTKSTDVLIERAREITRTLGISALSTDSAYSFDWVKDYADHLREHVPAATFWQRLGEGSPSVVDFWYRQSPRYLVPYDRAYLDYTDPPFLVPGMVGIRLEPDGKLKRLDVVPASHDLTKGPWPEPPWMALFREAGLDPASFQPVEPSWSPPVFADARAAWESSQGATRVEAAAYHGTPVFFRIIGPWTRPVGSPPPLPSLASRIVQTLPTIMILVVLSGGTILARRNLRLGRGDRRTAAIVAIFVVAAGLISWALQTHHVPTPIEADLLLRGLALVVLVACACWIFYLALEPYVRRLWPHALVSWVRLFEGRFRDPLVGRDVLFGVLAGAGFQLLGQAWPLASRWFGVAPPALDELGPTVYELQKLGGLRFAFANLASVQVALFAVTAGQIVSLLLLRTILRKQWLAVVAFVLLWAYLPASTNPYVALALSVLQNIAFLAVFFRFGLLTLFVANCVSGLLLLYPMTFDLTRWYAANTVVVLLVLASLTIYGFRVALAGRTVLGDAGFEH